jgi:hypothetical protein
MSTCILEALVWRILLTYSACESAHVKSTYAVVERALSLYGYCHFLASGLHIDAPERRASSSGIEAHTIVTGKTLRVFGNTVVKVRGDSASSSIRINEGSF